jgi:hypothetical protein
MNKETHIPMKYFMAVAIAPVVIFALAIALFLPLLGALEISRGGFLAELVSSSRNPFVQNFILIFAGYCCLPFLAIIALAGPPLTSFIANRKYPVFTNRSRAILGGGIFLAFNALFLVILLVFRLIEKFPSFQGSLITLQSTSSVYVVSSLLGIISYFIDPLLCLLSIVGIALSCSVAAAGRYGAQRGSLKPTSK